MIGWNTVGNGLSPAWNQALAYRDALRTSRTAVPQEAAAPAAESSAAHAPAASPALPGTAVKPLPTEKDLNNAADTLGRMRIRYPGAESSPVTDALNRAAELMNNLMGVRGGVDRAEAIPEEVECQTCKNRKYQDGSDDPGVSFKTPTALSPDEAATAVRGHEQEHVVRERAEAAREGRKVVSQSVTIHTDICPECGRVYVSGGTTRTQTSGKQETPSINVPDFEATA